MSEEYSWKDTNLALFGSDVEKSVKKEAAETEPAWKAINAVTSTTTLVWRVKNFKLEPVSEEDIGTFFRGDSYVVLHIQVINDNRQYDAYYWIGESSTQDEYGTAAYKTVELDTYLDDAAIQHREVDGYESDKFKSNFKRIIKLNGGYDSGFRKVEKEKFHPRLLHFHSEEKSKLIELSEVDFTRQSLNSNDVYIVDFGDEAYQWNGAKANKEEKIGAAQYRIKLSSERMGRCNTYVVDETDTHESNKLKDRLPVNEAKDKHKYGPVTKAIYKLSDESGQLNFSLVCEHRLSKSALSDNDVMFINNGNQLFVYIGKMCSLNEKKNAFAYAQEYMKTCPNPFLPITVVTEDQSAELQSILE